MTQNILTAAQIATAKLLKTEARDLMIGDKVLAGALGSSDYAVIVDITPSRQFKVENFQGIVVKSNRPLPMVTIALDNGQALAYWANYMVTTLTW